MCCQKVFTDEANLKDDKFTDFEDDENGESFMGVEIRIGAEETPDV